MIDWADFGIYDSDLPNDLEHVCSIGGGGGYDWTAFHAFWCADQERFFWHGTQGCSCDSWGDELHSLTDFSSGDRQALIQAIRHFIREYNYSVSALESADALHAAHTFSTRKATK